MVKSLIPRSVSSESLDDAGRKQRDRVRKEREDTVQILYEYFRREPLSIPAVDAAVYARRFEKEDKWCFGRTPQNFFWSTDQWRFKTECHWIKPPHKAKFVHLMELFCWLFVDLGFSSEEANRSAERFMMMNLHT
ncbi:MAG: hypothetical protein SGARI_002855 [Bacillariaceae sp.]